MNREWVRECGLYPVISVYVCHRAVVSGALRMSTWKSPTLPRSDIYSWNISDTAASSGFSERRDFGE